MSLDMSPTGNGDWAATGFPMTSIMDDGTLNAPGHTYEEPGKLFKWRRLPEGSPVRAVPERIPRSPTEQTHQ